MKQEKQIKTKDTTIKMKKCGHTAFIPVRGGSKSIPMKNITPLAGKPLVYWTAKAANDAECIDEVVVATDSEEIMQIVQGFKLPKVKIYERNPENARDNSATESVMLEYLQKTDMPKDDLFFLIQATSPLLKSRHIDGMYEQFMRDGADSALSCVKCRRFFWTKEGRPVNYDYKNRPMRQKFEGYYMENGACYINKAGNILEHGNRLFGRISVYKMPEYTSVEIDEPDDFIILEKLMEKYKDD